jgi:hypothetical protein
MRCIDTYPIAPKRELSQLHEVSFVQVMRISKHSPDQCPAYNAKSRAIFLDVMKKDESLAAKHQVKIIGVWVDSPGHTAFSVYDTPNMENLMDYLTEPEMMSVESFQTSEIKPLENAREIAKKFRK